MKIIGLILLMTVLISGCVSENENKELTQEQRCLHDKELLSCEELLDCYDLCDNKGFITHAMDCRDRLKARLWVCYGTNEIN